jgi:predicted transposase/invertase (TIGR01784 family)
MKLSSKPQNHFSSLESKRYFSTDGMLTVDLTSDYVFKGIFSDEGRISDFLKSILVGKNKVFPEDTEFEDIQFMKNEYIQNIDPDQAKKSIFDIQVRTKFGRFIVEIQKLKTDEFLKRTEFYSALAFSHQTIKDPRKPSMQDYLNALPIVVVSVVTGKLLDEDVPCVSYHINIETKTKKSFMKSFIYVFIELDKFDNSKYDQSSIDNINEQEWLELMKNQDITRPYTNKQVSSAVKYVDYVARNKYEEYIRAKMAEDIQNNLFKDGKRMGAKEGHEKGLKEGHEKGHEKGLKEGHEKGLKESTKRVLENVVQRLLDQGKSVDEIMNITNLTSLEVEETKTKN